MPPQVTEEIIVQALESNGGLIAATARTINRTPDGLRKRIGRSEYLQEKLKDIREANVDFAESQLMGLIKKGQPSAIIFFLKCLGKDRGYVERVENTGKDGKDLVLPVVAPPRATTMEEWMEQNKKESKAA